MNNIEILEDYIEALRKPKSFKYTNEQKAQAIENLIQENKELKEHLQKYYNGELYTAKQLKNIEENQRKYFINKSKIKEKIEEYNIPILDVLDKLPIMPRTIERGCGAKDGIIYVLQELLEEGE